MEQISQHKNTQFVCVCVCVCVFFCYHIVNYRNSLSFYVGLSLSSAYEETNFISMIFMKNLYAIYSFYTHSAPSKRIQRVVIITWQILVLWNIWRWDLSDHEEKRPSSILG